MPMVSLKLTAWRERREEYGSCVRENDGVGPVWVRGYDAMMSPVMSSKRSGGIAMRSTDGSQTPVIERGLIKGLIPIHSYT
jgi:hypothetical protein